MAVIMDRSLLKLTLVQEICEKRFQNTIIQFPIPSDVHTTMHGKFRLNILTVLN